MGDRSGPKVEARSADRYLHRGASRIGWCVKRRTAVDDRRARPIAPDTLLGISLAAFLAGARDFHGAVRAGRAARAAALLLERRTAGALDPRRVEARVRGADAVGRRLGAIEAAGAAGDRRGQRLALRHGGSGEQRRSARQRAGPDHAGDDDADRARQGPRRAQAGAAHVLRPTAGRHAARSDAPSTASAFPTCRSGPPAKPAMRPCT